jgi:glycosyltransferase involved in cell wall biosynthesis
LINYNGIESELHVFGQIDNFNTNLNLNKVIFHGYIHKNNQEHIELFNSILSKAHFYLLPTIADASPNVISEVSSYGVIPLAHSIGGIPDLIVGDVTGKLFDIDSPVKLWADSIIDLFKNKDNYKKMALAAYDYYVNTATWEVNIKKFISIINEKMVIKDSS